MAIANVDALFDKVRRLPADKLRQVEAFVRRLVSEGPERLSPFRKVAGTLDAEEAREMKEAVRDCERIDLRGW
jgi:hypothetical protein